MPLNEILQFLVDNDNLDLLEIQQKMQMEKEREIINNHSYKVWEGSNGKWYTYLPDDTKTRKKKLVKRNTQEDIENAILDYYGKPKVETVKDVFDLWLNKRVENNEIAMATVNRYQRDYKRYYAGTDFENKPISLIGERDVEDFIMTTIHKMNMNRKNWANMMTITNGIFKYARRNGMIDFNIVDVTLNLEMPKNEFVSKRKIDEEQVFLVEEEKLMCDYLNTHKDIINLALLLMFKTGLRVGELCTLKKIDFVGNSVEVYRTETTYTDFDGHIHHDVKESPKTEAGFRKVIIPRDCMWIVEKILDNEPENEWAFSIDNKRLPAHRFRERLYQNCEKLNLNKRSPHKVRKTYGSKLYDSELPKSIICRQMGHTDISCLEKYYYFNRNSFDETEELINQVGI